MPTKEPTPAQRKRKWVTKGQIPKRIKAEAIDRRNAENAENFARMKAEALQRWQPDTVCIKPRCLEPRHSRGYCERHEKLERRRERIQPR